MLVGLTGGIACGKSTVAQMLVERGAKLVDADQIAREVTERGSPILEKIVQQFGSDMLTSDGQLNRKRLGQHIFAHPEARRQLQAITHPAIRQRILEQCQMLQADEPGRLIIADIPLLFESGYEHQFEAVMVVYVPREVQRQRMMNRDGISEIEADQRLSAQMDIELKKQQATIVIDNQGSLASTASQIERWLNQLGGRVES